MSDRWRICSLFRMLSRRKIVLLLIFSTVLLFFFFVGTKEIYMDIAASFLALRQRLTPWSSDVCIMAVDQRRRLAATLHDVQREISKSAGIRGPIDAKWSLKLAAVAAELDPRLNFSSKAWDFSARLPEIEANTKLPEQTSPVCPEVYLGSKYDMPFNQHGMEAENCTDAPKFDKVLSAVLPAMTWKLSTVNFVIDQIRKLYNIPIIAIVLKEENYSEPKYKNLEIVRLTKDIDEASAINEALSLVKTPYTFMGLSLSHFNNQSSLERLVRVLDDQEHVKVAGGASRDHQGHWIQGCLQRRMANYQAYYVDGYYYSKYECMYCDDLLTPFVASTALLNISFNKGLSGPALYRDWFAKVHVNGYLTVSCPDVMFYVNNHPVMGEQDWMSIGKLWTLERIRAHNGQIFTFPCESVGISCQYPISIIYSFLLPPCCRTTIEKYMGYIADYGEEHKLAYELQAGSALAAVKMGGQMPWDFDADFVFMCKDYRQWINIGDILKEKHCTIRIIKEKRYFEVICPNILIDMICFEHNSTSQKYLPPEYQDIPTVAKYSGRYLKVNANPGLFSRNRFGLEDLKHAGHWRTLATSDDENASPGVWNYCQNPKHHSCLNHYPGEGNLPFLEPFLHL